MPLPDGQVFKPVRLWGPVLFKPPKSVIIPCPHSGDLCLRHLCIPCSDSIGVLFTGGNNLSSVVKWKHVSCFLRAHGKSTVHRADCEAHFVLSVITSEAQRLLSFPTRPSNKLRCSVTLVRIAGTNALTDNSVDALCVHRLSGTMQNHENAGLR